MKLSRKLTGAFVVLSLLVVSAVGLLAFESSRRALDTNIRNHTASISLLKEGQFNNWVDANSQALGRIAKRPLLYDLTFVLSTGIIETEDYNAAYDDIYNDHLRLLVQDSLGFTELFILHPDTGQILVSSDETQVGKYREDQPFFEEGRNQTYVQNPYYSLTRQEQIITIATPLIGNNDTIAGVLAGHLDLDIASEIMLEGFLDHETGDTFLINQFNFYVTRSRFSDQSEATHAIHSPGVESCLAQQTDTNTYINHAGIQVIGAYRWIEARELCILTEIHEAEAFAPILALRNTILGISSLVILLGIGMGVGFSRTITQPIDELVQGTEIIGSGKLNHRVGTLARDEIGGLSRAFDDMVSNLQLVMASRDDLNAEIERRKVVEQNLRERETTLSLALEAAQAGIWEWDIVGDTLKWDETVETMHWLEVGTFSGKFEDWRVLVHPDDIDHVEKVLQKALDGNQPYETEMRIINAEGEMRTLLSQGIVLRDEDGLPVRMIGIALDITKRKEIENELRERETKLSLSLKAAGAGVWTYDIETDLYGWDETMGTIYNFKNSVFDGTYSGWTKFLHPDDIDFVEEAMQRAISTNQQFDTTFRILRPDGTTRYVMAQAVVVRNENHEPISLIGVNIDVTERKQIENELRERETKLSLSLKAAGAGVWSWDVTSGHIAWDAVMEQIHGLEIGTFGSDYDAWKARVHPEDIEAAENAVQQAVSGIKPFDITFRIIRPDGMVRYVLGQAVVIRDDTHEPIRMIGVNIDVTERKQAEQALEKMSYDLIERVKELRGLQDIGQYEEEDLSLDAYFRKVIARIPASMQFPDICQVAIEFEGQVLGDDSARNSQWKIQENLHVNGNASGCLYVAYAQDRAFLDEEHTHVHAISKRIGHYVSRRRLFDELQQTLNNLAKSNRELEQFAYVASHDLQEPLRMVTNYLQLFKKRYEGQVDEKADKYIFYAVDGANRMKVLINDLLTFSRVTTRGAEFEETNMNEILGSVLKSLEVLCEDEQATITFDPLPTIHADGSQMFQLLQNLVGNAIKFRGQMPPNVHISATCRESDWEICVEDNGIGIEPEYYDQIFVIFKRLHTREHYEGTGIGLAVCKRIVERHGGDIWIESQPGSGSKFKFSVPIMEVEDERYAD